MKGKKNLTRTIKWSHSSSDKNPLYRKALDNNSENKIKKKKNNNNNKKKENSDPFV